MVFNTFYSKLSNRPIPQNKQENTMAETPKIITTKEMITVMQAFIDGERIEYTDRRHICWRLHPSKPAWDWDKFIYRIKEKEDDWVIWSVLPNEVVCTTRGKNNNLRAHRHTPHIVGNDWVSNRYIDLDYCLNPKCYKIGDKPWEESLVMSPNIQAKDVAETIEVLESLDQ